MSKKKKHKNEKPSIDWRTLLASAILDLIVGLALLLIGKYLL